MTTGNGARHIPASHPVLRRGLPSAARVQAQGIVTPRVWQEMLIRSVEEAVESLVDGDLDDDLRERYERALEKGHRDNLRWIRQAR